NSWFHFRFSSAWAVIWVGELLPLLRRRRCHWPWIRSANRSRCQSHRSPCRPPSRPRIGFLFCCLPFGCAPSPPARLSGSSGGGVSARPCILQLHCAWTCPFL